LAVSLRSSGRHQLTASPVKHGRLTTDIRGWVLPLNNSQSSGLSVWKALFLKEHSMETALMALMTEADAIRLHLIQEKLRGTKPAGGSENVTAG